MRVNGIGKRICLLGTLLASALVLVASAVPASAAVGPRWKIEAYSNTTVAPGETLVLYLEAKNTGDAAMNGSAIVWRADLPAGMVVSTADVYDFNSGATSPCFDASDGTSLPENAASIVCPNERAVPPNNHQKLWLVVNVDGAATGNLVPEFEVSGGGGGAVRTVDPITVSSVPPGFGIDAFDSQFSADATGAPLTQAGGHPYDGKVSIDFNTLKGSGSLEGDLWPAEPLKDVAVDLPPGLIGNPLAADRCTLEELGNMSGEIIPFSLCPSTSQVGTADIRLRGRELAPTGFSPVPVFNMVPPPGVPARFAFNLIGSIIVLDAELRGDYGLTVNASNIPQPLGIAGNTITFWGVPASADHDAERACPGVTTPYEVGGIARCASGASKTPFMRLPTACDGPAASLPLTARSDSWANPGVYRESTTIAHQLPGFPHQRSQWGAEARLSGCENVPVKGNLTAQPTSIDTSTSTGLGVHVEVPNPGLEFAKGIASSDIKAVKVALPEGMTINPSQAEGLGACLPAQYASTRLEFHPDGQHGCPSDSKIGTVSVNTPLLDEEIPGDVYIAQPFDNPFGSLLALYVVLHNEQRGVLIKLAGKVTTDPVTGQITAAFDDLPQLPFSTFDFHFREGARAPLVTPAACGTYTTKAEFTGWSDPTGHIGSNSSFEIVRGIGGGLCPSGGLPPFKPGLVAGSVSPSAGSY